MNLYCSGPSVSSNTEIGIRFFFPLLFIGLNLASPIELVVQQDRKYMVAVRECTAT
eukprot:m.336215 g.336215  ORF g.336215 m.336215 type:complete len:56 (+) comp20532_c2_seq1:2705-2872(+)